jgi:hypothetical protein
VGKPNVGAAVDSYTNAAAVLGQADARVDTQDLIRQFIVGKPNVGVTIELNTNAVAAAFGPDAARTDTQEMVRQFIMGQPKADRLSAPVVTSVS